MVRKHAMRLRYTLSFWLFVISGIAFLDRTNISIAGLAIIKEFGLNNQRLGWLSSAFLIGYAVCQIPAGWLAARFGPRRVITVSVLWWGVATAFTALVPSTIPHAIVMLFIVRFALGAGESVVYPAASQFVARWIPVQERGFINGLIFAGVGAGSGLTPPFLNWLITHHGWRSAFWVSALAGFAAGAVWWAISSDRPEEHARISSVELQEIHGDAHVPGLEKEQVIPPAESGKVKISWRAIFHRRDLVALMVAYFGFVYIAWIYFSWFFIYMAQVRGFDLKSSALFTMLPFLSMTLCCLAGGVASDWLTKRHGVRAGRCTLAAIASVVTAFLLIAGSQVHNPELAGIILSAGAGALYVSQSSYWSASVDIAGTNSGVFSSLINMAGQIGGAVAASLTPVIAQRFGWTMSFGAAAGLAMLAAACWLAVRPERPLISETMKSRDIGHPILSDRPRMVRAEE
jgi:ACS family glucarate transporter-like MFS transporter